MFSLAVAWAALALVGAADDEASFETKVRPILAGVCVRCHGPTKASGGLRLDSRAALLRGGDSGPAVVPGNPAESPLVMAIRRSDDATPMPPDKPLPPGVVNDLERWVATGAPWPDRSGSIRTARHWAFDPPRASEPPTIPGGPLENPIDAFLDARHRRSGVSPRGPADKRTLIRRATFDLIGLPPNPEDVEAFLQDESPRAFERVVDRLLASPDHGRKWGRMWLDVARYADTAGETADLPVPDAWRFRDYVINAFNADKPFDQFLREQIAGDLLAAALPDDAPPARFAELMTATGYLAVARRFGFDITKDHHLTIDDVIDTFGASVLGLTIGCARCHDHKYDPIGAADYYALYGIFDSTRFPFPGCEKDRVPRDQVPLLSNAESRRRLAPLQLRLAACSEAVGSKERAVAERAGRPATALATGEVANAGTQDFSASHGAERLGSVLVRKGEMIRLAIAPKAGHAADSTLAELVVRERGGVAREWSLTRDLLAGSVKENTGCRIDDAHGHRSVWQVWDGTSTPRLLTEFVRDAEGAAGLLEWRGGEPTPCVFINTNDRLTAFVTVKQPPRSVALHPGARGSVVVAWESPIDGEVSIAGRVEDIDPSGGDGIAWTIDLGPGLGPALGETVAALNDLTKARRDLDEFERLKPSGYAVAEGRPHDARVHERGDPATLGAEVPRRFLEVLGGRPVPPGAGSGRLELAGWVTDRCNPLTARVIVNRVWQGHFGQGLVRTPNNFGVRGEPPTHPDLLDWLAIRFVADGWSIKRLHRRIMCSAAYQRSSVEDSASAGIDPENRDLWRFATRRLSAEEIRDAMLAVSGDLDPTPGGAHPFPTAKSWQFTQHNPFVAVYDHDRRSVYLMTQRIKRHPFLALFDGADPNSSTARREVTTVPTQALFFLNDPFVHARAESLERRLAALPDDPARLDRACRLLYGRPPRETERAASARILASYSAGEGDGPPEDRRRRGWAALLRVMLSTNEFVYID